MGELRLFLAFWSATLQQADITYRGSAVLEPLGILSIIKLDLNLLNFSLLEVDYIRG